MPDLRKIIDNMPRTNVFFNHGEKRHIPHDAALYGNSGFEHVLISNSPTIELDGNFERLDLSNVLSQYQFYLQGTNIRIKQLGSGADLTFRGMNGPVTLAFANGSAVLRLNGFNNATLNGKQLPLSFAQVVTSLNTSDVSETAGW